MATIDYTTEVGSSVLRKEVIDKMIKQTAAATYKFKQALSIVPTSAWKNTFYREGTSVLLGNTGNTTARIPRGAAFPHDRPNWTEISVRIIKYGLETNIPWEDLISGNLDVQTRSIVKLTAGVTKAVDDQIWDELTESQAGTGVIQSFAIGVPGYGGHWDESSAAIVDNLMYAAELISTNGNYDTDNLMAFISPKDHRQIMNYIADKGTQWNDAAQKVMENGKAGRIAGVQLVVSNSVTASYALVIKPKTAATYNELVSLRSDTEMDPFKSLRIRIVEEGSVSLTDPRAIVLIENTQS